MNKTNLSYRILTLVLMIGVMFLVMDADINLYRMILMGMSGWQLGSWVGDWSRAKWPLYD
mgnify:FL=1